MRARARRKNPQFSGWEASQQVRAGRVVMLTRRVGDADAPLWDRLDLGASNADAAVLRLDDGMRPHPTRVFRRVDAPPSVQAVVAALVGHPIP